MYASILANSGYAVPVSWPDDQPATWVGGTLLLRLGEGAIAALPEMLVGLLLAGLLRHILGDVILRRWLSRGNWGDLPRGLLFAVALPVGAMGVLPVVLALLRARVRMASLAVVTFGGAALNPLSLAWLLDRAGVLHTVLLVAMLTLGATVVFMVHRRLVVSPAEGVGTDVAGLLPALAESRELALRIAPAVAVGLLVFAATAALLPPSTLGNVLMEQHPLNALLGIAVPALGYVAPETASLQAAEALQTTYPGVAWTSLVGGSAFTVATLIILLRIGPRIAARYLACFCVILLLGFTVLNALTRPSMPSAEDTHAFDGLSRPYHVVDDPGGVTHGILMAWQHQLTPPALASAGALAALVLIPWPRFAAPSPADRTAAAHLSTRVTRGAVVIYGVVWLGGTLLVYLPSAPVTLDEMRHAEGELSSAAAAGDLLAIESALQRVDVLAYRGQLGSYLRLHGDEAKGLEEIRRQVEELSSLEQASEGSDLFARFVPLFRAISAARNAAEGQ